MKVIYANGRFTLLFAWYDLWVGAYYDVGHRVLYVLPLPTLVLRFQLPGKVDEAQHRKDRQL